MSIKQKDPPQLSLDQIEQLQIAERKFQGLKKDEKEITKIIKI